jgi:hypothetical protein
MQLIIQIALGYAFGCLLMDLINLTIKFTIIKHIHKNYEITTQEEEDKKQQ